MADIQQLANQFETSLTATLFRASKFTSIGFLSVDLISQKTNTFGISKSQAKRIVNEKIESEALNGKTLILDEFLEFHRHFRDCRVELLKNGKNRVLGLVVPL